MSGKTIKEFPKTEKECLTYYEQGGNPIYKITRVLSNGTYKLYQKVKDGYKHIKSRSSDPLFNEVL